jgi:hypothetical protein
MTGKELFDLIQSKANGDNYAPCFRDCLGDNEAWVVPILADALQDAYWRGQGDQGR